MTEYAVVLRHNRNIVALLDRLATDGTSVVVIDSNSDEPLSPGYHTHYESFVLVLHDNEPVNISRLWNRGILECQADGPWYDSSDTITILNDDVMVPPNYCQIMKKALVKAGCTIAFPDQFKYGQPGQCIIDRSPPGPCLDLTRRMTGYAFTMWADDAVLADERLVWWAGDNDVEMQARQRNGTVMVGGVRVEHADPNGNTNRYPELMAQAGRDLITFESIWGFKPF